MKQTFLSILSWIFVISMSIAPIHSSFSHALLPDEVITFIEENPDVTDEEIENFFMETYGYGIEEFWENNPDPVDELMQPSEEFLAMQANGEIPEEYMSQETINSLTTTLLKDNEDFQSLTTEGQEIFLRNAMQLKYQKAPASFMETVSTYIQIGIEHILKGTDHVLFVLSLLLLAFSIKRLVLLISIFTVAHSVTLILSGLEIITLPSSVVEPIIAFSIAYTAITSLFMKKYPVLSNFKHHIAIIFIFGLFHGLGFAGAFAELAIESSMYIVPLLLMNIGVELGQIFILLIAFPILWVIRQQKGGNIAISIFAIAIAAMALFWFWERTL